VLVAALVLGLGLVADARVLHVAAAGVLIAFGVFRFARPRAHFRWTKMRVTRSELTLWSFLMATAHGAGLMVAPVLIGASAAGEHEGDHALAAAASLSVPESALAIALHVGAMLLVMGAVAVIVYEKLGVAVLRRAWVNSDHLWAGAFVVAGLITLVT
jgi:hypothetical protein